MTLKNRIMFPPMTTGYEARDGSITEQSINFYKRVAEGGASYIVLGDVTPVHTISPTPKLVTDEQIPSFKALADALHEFGCKLGLQVFHPEYDTVAVAELFAKGDMAGAQAKLHHDMQHYINEVTGERLQEILVHITALARRATQAGADAIEVHGDRLVGSLCSPLINQRTDEYGGSFENRTRFARAVVRAIREGSPDICIDYKLPIITENPQLGRGGLFIDEAVELAKLLEADGVDTFHVGQANHTGNLNDTIPAMGTRPECFMAPYARRVKEAVSVPVSTVGRIMTPEDGYEYKRVITPAGTPRKIAVVGGGPRAWRRRASPPAADVPEPQTQAISIPCDCVVIASGTAPVAFDTAALEAHGIKVTLVGDCNGKAADINRAVEEGYLAATAA